MTAQPDPPRTVPLVCEFRTNDPGIAEMLNMIEQTPRFTADREELIGQLHLQMAALAFKHAGEYRVRERDLARRRKKETT